MRRLRFARTEMFEVIDARTNSGKMFAETGERRLDRGLQGFRRRLGAQIEDELSRRARLIEPERQLRDKIAAHQAESGDVVQAAVRAEGHFQMRDLTAA